MTRPYRTLSRTLLMLLALTAVAHSAVAQDAMSPPVPPARVVGDRFCRDHWLAMGSCRDRPWAGPELMFGADVGISKMNESGAFGFNNGVGAVTDAGPAWGVRGGVEFLPWLALEARYVGMYNSTRASVSPAGSTGYFTTGGEAIVRFTAPLPYVHPYVFGGVGYYDNSLIGSSSARA